MYKFFIVIIASLIIDTACAMCSPAKDSLPAIIERSSNQIEIPPRSNYYNYYFAIYSIKNQMHYLLEQDKYKKGDDSLIGLIKEEFCPLGTKTTQGMILETYNDVPHIICLPLGSVTIFYPVSIGKNGAHAFFNEFQNSPSDNPTFELESLTPDDKQWHIKKYFWIKRVHDIKFSKPEIDKTFLKKDIGDSDRVKFLGQMWKNAKEQHETIFKKTS